VAPKKKWRQSTPKTTEEWCIQTLSEMTVLDYEERISNLGVHNLTELPISPSMRMLLAKGTNFVPTPKLNKNILMNDLLDYKRRLEWRNHFWEEEKNSSVNNPEENILLKKFYIPKKTILREEIIPPEVREKLKNMLRTAVINMNNLPLKCKNNLTFEERKDLKSFSKQDTLMILPSDKNLGLVLLKKEKYNNACIQHLQNATAFIKIKCMGMDIAYNKFIKQLQQTEGFCNLHPRIVTYLQEYKSTKNSNFYMLPKIHKLVLGWRPIIPSIGTWNYPFAKVVDYYLQPIVKQSTSYLKDTGDLIEEIKKLKNFQEDFTSKIWLVTVDVEQLYPSIPLEEAFNVTADLIKVHQPKLAKVLIKMLRKTLFNNVFSYNNQTYLQVNGVATGSPVAPSVANLFLASLEKGSIITWQAHLLVYRRYIDDIFIIFKGSECELRKFQLEINSLHTKINLTWEVSLHKNIFLDLVVFKGDRYPQQLDYKVHQKQLNNYLYLPWVSSHPMHTKINLIKGEIKRYMRNCSRLCDYINIKKCFAYRLLRRGYPPAVINSTINAVSYRDYKKQSEEHETSKITHTQQQQENQSQIIVFKTYYVSTMQLVAWSSILNPQKVLNKKLKCLTAYKKTKNLFSYCKQTMGT
jgi:hypothetical protein